MPKSNRKDKESSSEWVWSWSDDDTEFGSTFDSKEEAIEDASEELEGQDDSEGPEIIVFEVIPRCKLTRIPGVKVTKL